MKWIFPKFLKKPIKDDRRQYIRLKTGFPVDIKLIDKITGAPITETIPCFTKDVSKGGIQLTLTSPSKKLLDNLNSPNTKISIALSPFAKKTIIAFGVIAWHKIQKQGSVPKLNIGIAYVDIIKEEQEKIYKYAKFNRRKPYEIAFVMILLFLYASFASYNYYNSLFINNKLQQQIKNIISYKNMLADKVSDLANTKQKLNKELRHYKNTTSTLKNEINKITGKLADEQTESFIQNLKEENITLKETILNLRQEQDYIKQQLKLVEDKKLYLQIKGSEFVPNISLNKQIDIITLNNQNVLIGTIEKELKDKIALTTFDETKTDIKLADIKNINTLLLVDSSMLQEQLFSQEKKSDTKIASIKENKLEFLKKLSYDSFLYFINEKNEKTGLIKDTSAENSPASISACGFALAAYCIAEKNGWASFEESYNMCLKLLQTFDQKLKNEHGFFYHFVDPETGERAWNSEASTIDTAIFISGALLAGEYFKKTEVEKLANKLYGQIDWNWMTNNTSLLSMGFKPESDFLPYYWNTFNEGILAYILGIGSKTHPLPASSWTELKRLKSNTESLFVYQYPQIWVNFKNIKDNDYWQNAVDATYANRQFCIDNKDKFKTYSETSWGLTASIGPEGYKAYGANPEHNIHDGTVAPSAVAGSVPFAPEICIPTLQYMYQTYGSKLYGFYGFKDAYNIDKNWFADKYVGINQGISVLMIENYINGFVWNYFMELPAVKNWEKIVL